MKLVKIIEYSLIIFLVFIIYSSVNIFVEANSLVDGVEAAVVMDSRTGRILFEKKANEKRPMASLTKMMTSILLVENCDMDEKIEIPAEAAWIGGSEVGLKKGDMVSAKSLLYGMLLPSRE